MGKSPINGQFSMAMLNNQRVHIIKTGNGRDAPRRFLPVLNPHGPWKALGHRA